MFTEGYSFPHPVLGNDDDISGEFNISLEIARSEARTIVFDKIAIQATNPYIKKLIDEDIAKCFIKIHCSSTFRTWMFESSAKFELNENEIVNKVEVQVIAIANTEIADYSHSSFNSQYGAEIFRVGKNEVIAISGSENIQIPKVDEKLGLGNIFKFHSHQTDWPISFQYMQDKIFINYPVTKKGEHPPNMLFSTNPWTAYNLFIVPALTEALRFIDEQPEVANKYRWFSVIDQLMPAQDRTKEFFGDAQTILLKELPVLMAGHELSGK